MLARSIFTFAALFSLALAQGSGAFADVREYDKQSVEFSMRSNELVVLDFHVTHCPLCHSKSPYLEQVIAKDMRAGRVQAFLVDFDNDEGLKRKYNVKYRNTAIFIHRNRVVGRMAGDFSHEMLEKEFRDALNAAFAKVDAK
ncbi:MAG: thioredoxin family protein [Deltaproteobacteria bacterium]|nr:thioredoxin family protein [Deltaproteobacteria bacterium]